MNCLEFTGKKILVVGDAMTDEFLYCETARRSPEANCNIVRVVRRVITPGGAANTARCIEALGAKALLLSRCGEIKKTRIVVDGIQIVRMDDEDGRSDTRWIAREAVEGCHAVVISDYAKGTITREVAQSIISAARTHEVPVIVDPKNVDFSIYDGATVLMPNESEYARATSYGSTPCLVTQGARGMRFGDAHFPPFKVAVKDVAGAGDSATATVALMLACGATIEEAAPVACVCAALAVAKEGVAIVPIDELRLALRPKRVGFCNGCFDLFHPGHLHFLLQASRQCDRLVVAINSDASVRRLKGAGRPVQPLTRRRAVLDALYFVAETVVCEDDPTEMIRSIAPDVIFRGYDQTPSESGDWVRISHLPLYSTTARLASHRDEACGEFYGCAEARDILPPSPS